MAYCPECETSIDVDEDDVSDCQELFDDIEDETIEDLK